MNPDIAIVAIGYNRPHALGRLLESLTAAHYGCEVKLYISVDGEGGEGEMGRKGEEEKGRRGEEEKGRRGEEEKGRRGEEVRKVAADFAWPFGEKKLIFHEANLGLREHVLACGDLSQDHDGIIVLEDDLVVSPAFYDFAIKTFEYYSNDPKIAGISLYHHAYNETAQFPFIPLADGSDVYFLQYASSWGQVWGREHWKGFRKWYDTIFSEEQAGKPVFKGKPLPANIKLWPKNSWKRYFISYLIEKDLYFVYPRTSFTTVFGDEGTNIRVRETFLQVPLFYGERQYIFKPFDQSCSVYDTWCEILPDRLRRLCPELANEVFDVDLYGMKFMDDIASDKIISGRVCKQPMHKYNREMKPHEENIIRQLPGEHYHFGRKEDFSDTPYLSRLLRCHEKKELAYWYPIREYHFYRKKLLATSRNPYSPSNPGFLFRKLMSVFSYVLRYFLGRK